MFSFYINFLRIKFSANFTWNLSLFVTNLTMLLYTRPKISCFLTPVFAFTNKFPENYRRWSSAIHFYLFQVRQQTGLLFFPQEFLYCIIYLWNRNMAIFSRSNSSRTKQFRTMFMWYFCLILTLESTHQIARFHHITPCITEIKQT